MRFTIKSDELKNVVSSLVRVVPSRPVSPAFGGILLTANEDGVFATASDSNIRCCVRLSATDIEPGKVLILGRFFGTVVDSLPDEDIHIETEADRTFVIRYGAGQTTVPVVKDLDFPDKENIDGEKTEMIFSGKDFIAAVQRVAYAMGDNELYPNFMGVCLDVRESETRFVASDRTNLALLSTVKGGVPFKSLIPGYVIPVMKCFLQKDDGDVTVAFTKKRMYISADGLDISAQICDKDFPDYDKLIEGKSDSNILSVRKSDIVGAVKRMSVCAGVTNPMVKMELAPDGESRISGEDQMFQMSGSEKITGEYQGEPLTVTFKSGMLIDALSHFGSEDLKLHFVNQKRPVVIDSDQEPEMTAMVMPMVSLTPATKKK